MMIFIKSTAHAINDEDYKATNDSVVKQKNSMPNDSSQTDIIDVLKNAFGPKLFGTRDTLPKRKGKLYLSVLPAVGYSLHTDFAATIGANGAFYIDDPQKVNLSVVNFGPTYTIKRQWLAPIQSNIWTKDNKYNLLGNWIFYKFPEVTYGLGGHTSTADADSIDYKLILFNETVLRSIVPDFFIGVGYALDYHWNITESQSSYEGGGITDFDRYGKTSTSSSSGITLNVLYDNRRNPINPPKGYFLNVIYRANYTFLGSDQNWQSVLFDLRKYFKLTSTSDNVLAVWSYTWLTLSGKPPYLDLPSTAWDTYANQGRGYIQSRFKGDDLIALESEYRFGITPNGLIGGVVFADIQSVSNWPSNKIDAIWPGEGLGIRIKFNKHSDTNAAIDYAWGLGGSQGFFVNLGEVF
jgi:hypothetical protein